MRGLCFGGGEIKWVKVSITGKELKCPPSP